MQTRVLRFKFEVICRTIIYQNRETRFGILCFIREGDSRFQVTRSEVALESGVDSNSYSQVAVGRKIVKLVRLIIL